MKKMAIRPGDRFARAENPKSVWVVDALVTPPHTPPHVRLSRTDDPYRIITLSVSALLDRRLYRRMGSV